MTTLRRFTGNLMRESETPLTNPPNPENPQSIPRVCGGAPSRRGITELARNTQMHLTLSRLGSTPQKESMSGARAVCPC